MNRDGRRYWSLQLLYKVGSFALLHEFEISLSPGVK